MLRYANEKLVKMKQGSRTFRMYISCTSIQSVKDGRRQAMDVRSR